MVIYSVVTYLSWVTISDGWSHREFTNSSKEASWAQKKEKEDEKDEYCIGESRYKCQMP